MSKRKSRLAQRRPIGSFGHLAADVSKYGLNDRSELRKATNAGELAREAKKFRADLPQLPGRRK